MKITPVFYDYKTTSTFSAQRGIQNSYGFSSYPSSANFALDKNPRIVNFGAAHFNPNTKLLDCTLRDGGFINKWKFGHRKILEIFTQLDKSKVNIIEVGYLYNNCKPSLNRTRFPNTEAIKKTFKAVGEKNALVSAMIDYGDCDLKNIGLKKDGFIDIIRIAFKKKDVDKAIEFAKSVRDKGYDIFIQPTSITSYSEKEMLDTIGKINELKPKVMSIVDTYGLLDKENLNKYFQLMNKNLDASIDIGFHSHNNLQLGFSNSVALANKKTGRNIYLDGSLYGMGKGAGNANIELLAMELDRKCDKKYDINRMLEVIDRIMLSGHGKNKWGYSLQYFIASLNSCHPDYVKFLYKKKASVTQINEILKNLEQGKKLQYDEKYIESLYLKNKLKMQSGQ